MLFCSVEHLGILNLSVSMILSQEALSGGFGFVFFKGVVRQMDSVSTLIFQKEFNKVHYQKLLKKLIYHGIEEKTPLWLNKKKDKDRN